MERDDAYGEVFNIGSAGGDLDPRASPSGCSRSPARRPRSPTSPTTRPTRRASRTCTAAADFESCGFAPTSSRRRACVARLRLARRPERWGRDLPAGGVGTGRSRAPTLRGMDLAQHAAVLWRFRAVVAGGLVLGIVLAVLAAYQLPSFTPRGSETWSSDRPSLVTQAGSRGPRVPTLAGAPAGGVDQIGPDGAAASSSPTRTGCRRSRASTPSSPRATACAAQLPEKPKACADRGASRSRATPAPSFR